MHAHHRLDWEPNSRHWRIAVFFMVGSTCFALGSLPAYVARLDVRIVGLTFFVGSVWFTMAALGQWYETIVHASPGEPRRLVIADDLDWWAGGVQFVGTLMFNVSTAAAMVATFDAEQIDRFVWGPDMIGSVCFLVASGLAWRAVCGRLWCVRLRDTEWRVAALNMAGSIFFMASAIASWVVPTTGDDVNAAVVNSTTLLGAVCFFAGAFLLLPLSRSTESS